MIETLKVSRRVALAALASTPMAGFLSPVARAETVGRRRSYAPTMPAPSGPYCVGVIDLHLVDPRRMDPWSRAERELMVNVYYPARQGHAFPVDRYLSAAMADAVGEVFLTAGEFELPAGTIDWNGMRTHAHRGAPVERDGGPFPVLIYSTYHLRPRNYATAAAEDLASRGYVVVTMDSTHEAMGVEFPGERIELTLLSPIGPYPLDARQLTAVRAADIRFVIDRLHRMQRGHDIDGEKRTVPWGLKTAMDLSRIGVWGTVGGSIAGLQAAYEDRRVRAVAGLNDYIGVPQLDYAPVVHHGLDRPYLLMSGTEEPNNHKSDPGWRQFWPKLRSWKLNVELRGSHDHAFGDYLWIAGRLPALSGPQRQALVGAVDPDSALAGQRAYLAAFFDLVLRGRDHTILHRPSPHYPQMAFIR